MASQPNPYLTEEQYLEIERKAERRSEYWNGEMFAMAGGTARHADIKDGLVFVLRRELHGSGCRTYSSDLRVKTPATGLYTYPDLLVICGKLEYADDVKDTVTNPKVIIEVLSPSTELYDRGNKFVHYRSIPSFQEYLLVAQDRIYAEHHVKQSDGSWHSREITDAAATITLESLAIRFKLMEAYSGVEF